MADLGPIEEDVPFDEGVADALISTCTTTASTIEGQTGTRSSLVSTASAEFRGLFAELFAANGSVASADAGELAARLREVADGARRLKEEARKEQRRREVAREWKREQDDRNLLEHAHDFFFGEEDPPVGPPATEPTIPVSAPRDSPRQTPQPGSGGGGGGGTSSARPEDLRSFASGSTGLNDELRARPGAVRGRLADFAASCRWGTLSADGVATGFDLWLTANDNDVRWATTIADAFAAAGGEGDVSTLSDSALTAALRAAGVNAARQDLDIPAPQAFGAPPTTGYANDPVNTATGNFLEPETDLAFVGGASSLVFRRMYNSLSDRVGAFGRGWASTVDVGLALDDSGATMTLPDGRAVRFPRLGDGWDRADGENRWLTRERVSDAEALLVVSDIAGERWTFTPAGRWLCVDRGAGTRVITEIDAEGRLVALRHERGRHVDIEWSGERVSALASSDGRRIVYTYDGDRLIGVAGASGERRYRWNEDSLIDAVVDAAGVVEAENVYDERGRVVAQRSPFGRVTRFAYLPGMVTVASDADGARSTSWLADPRGRLIGVIDAQDRRQSMAYDRWGNLVSVTERDGAVTVHAYDHRGRRIRTVTPTGADLTFGYDDHDRVTTVVAESGAATVYGYEGDDRSPSTIVDPEGGETRLVWADGLLQRVVDPTGVELSFTYDTYGDLLATTDAEGHTARLERDAAGRVTAAVSPEGHRTTYVYDATGALSSRREADGGVWRFERDAAGRLVAVIDPLGGRTDLERADHGEVVRITDPLGRATARVYDDLGNLASTVLPDGATWRFTHDALSRLVEQIDPAGHALTREYDAVGDLVAVVDPTGLRRTAEVDRRTGTLQVEGPGIRQVVGFDALGRPVRREDADGEAALTVYDRCGRPVELLDADGGLIRLVRDAAGRVIERHAASGAIVRFTYDPRGRLAAVIDPDGARTEFAYDADGRLVRRTLPTGEVAVTTYDEVGRVIAADVPGVGTARYRYDRVGRLVWVRDPRFGTRRFRYDAAGQLVEAENGVGGVTRYDYDEAGRVVAITDPLGGVVRRSYDALGRAIGQTDPLGRETTAGYDAAGRQLWQRDPDGHRTEWAYDDAGRVRSVSVDGRLQSVFAYDPRGREAHVEDHTAGEPSEIVLRWNGRGALVERARDGKSVRWEYDVDGACVAVTSPDGATVRYERDAAGRIVAAEHPAFGRTTFAYDAAGRLVRGGGGTELTWRGGFVAEARGTGGSTRIERDDEGRVVAVSVGAQTTRYQYDGAGQLVEARGEEGVTDWQYDAAGRLVRERSMTRTRDFTYDVAGQLIAVTDADGTRTTFVSDGLGRRVREERADGMSRSYAWSDLGYLRSVVADGIGREILVDALGQVREIDGLAAWWDSPAPDARLIQVGDTPFAHAPATTGVAGTWLDAGWRGIRAVAPEDPWAVEPAASSPAPGVEITVTGGVVVDGVEWLGRRVYDPAARGFLSTDPLDPIVGAGWAGNPYAYAGNDPLQAVDPTGLRPVTDAELQAYRDANNGAFAAAGDWIADNWEYIAAGAMVVAGVALMFTGVGGVAGIALMAGAGALTAGGVSIASQKATTGEVDWGQVGVNMAIGGVGGAIGGVGMAVGRSAAQAAAASATSSAGRLASVVGVNAAVNGGVGAVGGAAVYTVQHAGRDWDWREFAASTVGGGVAGSLGGLAGPAGGSLSRMWGSTATSGLAATASMTMAGGANVVGLGVGNLIGGEDTSWTDVGLAAGSGAFLSRVPLGPSQSTTLNQMQYFNPTSLQSSLTTINGRRLWASAAAGVVGGGGIDIMHDAFEGTGE